MTAARRVRCLNSQVPRTQNVQSAHYRCSGTKHGRVRIGVLHVSGNDVEALIEATLYLHNTHECTRDEQVENTNAP
jgi:hypothetical protein